MHIMKFLIIENNFLKRRREKYNPSFFNNYNKNTALIGGKSVYQKRI